MTKSQYQEALDWLFVQMPNYQINGKKAYKPGLGNIERLCSFFDNPQKDLQMIHIGGTNGKGSTSSMVASILQQQGYKVGLYTSPHLVDFTERIKVNGSNADKNFVYRFIRKLKEELPSTIRPSFFEFTTVMAFQYFKEQKVNFAVIEVGLGGRLDATNIIHPLVAAITNVGLDHTDILGNTIAEIAREKAGIIKPGIPIVCGDEKKVVQRIISEIAIKEGAKLCDATKIEKPLPTDLKGFYQENNVKVAQAIVDELRLQEIKISEDNLRKGLLKVQENTHFIGRWYTFSTEPLVICDTAHNVDGFNFVVKQLATLKRKKHLVLGFVKEKDLAPLIPLLPKKEKYYFVKPSISRGRAPRDYENLLRENQLNYHLFNSVEEGFLAAKENCGNDDMIFIGGSNFVLGDFLKKNLYT